MFRSFNDWTLQPAEQALIHNYAYSAARPAQAAQLARFMIEDRGILQAGSDKNLVIMGLSYVDMVQPIPDPDYFADSLKCSGVYSYDPDTGIHLVSQNPAVNFVKTECARSRSFVLRLLGGQWHLHPAPSDPAAFRRENYKRMDVNYEPILADSLKQMGLLLDDERAARANARRHSSGGHLERGHSRDTEYFAKMCMLFAEKGIPVIHTEHSVPDNEYFDAVHCNEVGRVKIQAIIEKIAVDFLHKTGALAN